MSDGPCFLYAIATVHDGSLVAPVKIGISSQPQSRIRELQTGSAHRLAFALLIMLDDRAVARKVEQGCLQRLGEHALTGEWVNLPPLDVVGELLGLVIRAHGFVVAHPPIPDGEVLQ